MASNTHSLDWDQNIQWPWIKPVWTRDDRSGFQLWKSIFSNSFVLLNLALCHACMDDCMNEWMHECTNARMHEFTNAWMNELMSAVIPVREGRDSSDVRSVMLETFIWSSHESRILSHIWNNNMNTTLSHLLTITGQHWMWGVCHWNHS